MPMTVLDDLSNPALWQALAPDGVTPSTALSLTLDSTRIPPASVSSSARITGSTAALNNTLRRTLAPVDLTNFHGLRLWISGSRAADGTASRLFFLELRLASAAMALTDPGNTWQRYLPVSQAGTWEVLQVSIGDLPAAVRGALTTIQLRCADASIAFTCNIQELIAFRDAMISDVDAALRASLDGILSVGGATIPAVLHPAEGPQSQARPYIEILQFDARYSRQRTDSTPTRGDFTNNGFSLRPPTNAYDLFYQITAFANDRATQAAMLEFVLRTLPARGQLMVNGMPLPMEAVYIQPINQIGGFRTDQIPLFYRLFARQEVGPGILVQPPRNVIVTTDQNAA
jgi:hypothetical protein